MLRLIAQKRHNECHIGVALTVLSAFYSKIKYKKVRENIIGNSLFDIRSFLESNNIKAYSIRFVKEKLNTLDFKIMIVHIKNLISEHYAVLEKESGTIYYYDPANYFRHRLKGKDIKKLDGYGILIRSEPKIIRPKYIFQVHFKTKIMILTIIINAILIIIIYN